MDIKHFKEENYLKMDYKVKVYWVNIFGFIVLAVAVLLFGIPFYFVWPEEIKNLISTMKRNITLELQFRIINTAIILIIFLLLIVIHELIHGIFFSLFSEYGFKSIKFGIMSAKKLFTPYCIPKEILKINHWRIAVLMPLVIMGIIPTLISIFFGKIILFLWGIILIVAGSGDLWFLIEASKLKKDSLIYFPKHTEMIPIIYQKNSSK